MKIFELKCKAYLKTNIELKSSFDVLSKYLNYSIYQNEIYKNKDTSIKNYCFGNFYPTESDKIYKKNNVYEFVLSLDSEKLPILICFDEFISPFFSSTMKSRFAKR